ncbi:hypothetical protein J6590_038623 [Homalodisca vitripennis]|nr:hypothetical protein J6590_038623 [Homalodisca vitripennis]
MVTKAVGAMMSELFYSSSQRQVWGTEVAESSRRRQSSENRRDKSQHVTTCIINVTILLDN